MPISRLYVRLEDNVRDLGNIGYGGLGHHESSKIGCLGVIVKLLYGPVRA